MHPTFAFPPYQPRSLQRLLHPGVAQFNPAVRLQLFVKVPHIQIEILLPVESEHLLHGGHRHPPGGRLATAPVEQSVITKPPVAFPPTPHRTIERSLIATTSAACHHVIFFAITRKMTSCTFIARSIAAFDKNSLLAMGSYSHRPQSGHITCYFNRTYHLLPTLALLKPCANCTPALRMGRRGRYRLSPRKSGAWRSL